jgi:hypothetical protein
MYEDKLKQLTQEIGCKDEQLGYFKVEVNNLQEKIKAKGEEV